MIDTFNNMVNVNIILSKRNQIQEGATYLHEGQEQKPTVVTPLW